MEPDGLARRDRVRLAVQRAVGRLLAPLWVPAAVGLMRFALGWRIEGTAAARRAYRALCGAGDVPVLVCANHLTMVDSALVAWALGSPGWYLTHWAALPWNVPERRNFGASLASRCLVWVMKCVPVVRGGDRREVGLVLRRLAHLLRRGEAVLVFPEGRRSRAGRVEVDDAAWGVGRLIAAVPGCRVLCVYLRGERQDGFSDLPARGERFHARVATVRPTSDAKGMRRARDLARQVARTLAELEREHFDARE